MSREYPTIFATLDLGFGHAATITPNDATDLAEESRAIYVGGAGDVALLDSKGNGVTFKAVPLGTILPVRASRIKATGTSATNLVALW